MALDITLEFAPQTLASPSGASLNVRCLAPAGAPLAVVQINHGMAEHCARYERFARFLAARGYASVAHDHRGHGATVAPDAQLGIFGKADGWNKVLADVSAVTEAAQKAWPQVPVVTFGHSMGAIIALDWLAENPGVTQAGALWNTSFDTPPALPVLVGLLKGERFFKGSDTPSRLAVALTFDAWNRKFAPNRTGFDWLSRDTAEVDAYVADPLCGFPVSVGAWLDVIGSIRRSADKRRIGRLPKDLPLHLCAGSQDPSSLGGSAMDRLGARLRSAGMSGVTVRIVEGARHEGLHELNRDEIMSGFASWLDGHFKSNP